MDRNNKETEELNKQVTLISATPTTKKPTNISTTPSDDDTSVDFCDSFEPWTLVNGNRTESLKNSDIDEEDPKKEDSKTEQYSLNDAGKDDFSDSISVISENESTGHISPHPNLRDHLHDLNLKFSSSDYMDDVILNQMRAGMENDVVPLLVHQAQEPVVDQQLRQRRRSSTASANADNHALQKASQTVAITSDFVPLVKRGLHGIFYMGVGLALLGLIGKIVNPTWQPLPSVANSPSTADLEQKINDIELQNNLMRAEIDLLNKRVKYLYSLNEPQQPNPGKYKEYKQSKTFKAWPGNGNTLKPVDITKEDLRKPYKCPDGSFVEIANMCIEQRPANEPSIVYQFGHVMDDLKKQAEAFRTFEQVAEEVQGFQDNPFEPIFTERLNTETPTKQFIKNKPIYETPNNKENLPYAEKYQKHQPKDPNFSATYKHNKYAKVESKEADKYKVNKEYKKSFGKDEFKQNKEYKKHPDNGNFRDNSKERNQWKTDKFGNNSKEHYTKDFGDSKESSKENQYKERYTKQKRKYDNHSAQWQEKYMNHREQQRKQNEQTFQDNRNWYIKRARSRENKRSGE